MSDYFGKEVPKLGFGLMRLPKKGMHTDIELVFANNFRVQGKHILPR